MTKLRFLILVAALSLFTAIPVFVSADIAYTTLAPIPALGLTQTVTVGGGSSLVGYFNSIVRVMVSLAVGLSVLYLMYAGIQYSTTDSFSSKGQAKATMQRVLGGLILALTSWLILNTLNPALLTGTINQLTDIGVAPLSEGSKGVDSTLPGATGGTTAGGISAVPGGDSGGTQSSATQDAYTKIYDQWTDNDEEALENGDTAALNKWNSLQSQIDSLNNSSPQPAPGSANVGAANQKVLSEIASGFKCTDTNCFESAVDLYKAAGVTQNSVFQNSSYIVGGKTLSSFGTAAMPVPGQMVDMYTGYDKTDPFHTVIVDSIDANGSAVVWDWHHNAATGLRQVTFNLDSPGTKGYIGRIYSPTQ